MERAGTIDRREFLNGLTPVQRRAIGAPKHVSETLRDEHGLTGDHSRI
jgi:hypothetical protein